MAENSQQQNKSQNSAPTQQSPQDKKPTVFQVSQKKQKNTSIFFLIWTVISALVVLISISFGIAQQVMMTQSYKSAAARELTEKGGKIQEEVLKVPSASFGGNYSGYLRFLSRSYDVGIFILSEDGEVLFPQEPNFDTDAPEIEEQFNFAD